MCDLVYFEGGVVGKDFVAALAFDGVYHVFASNVFAVGSFVEEFVAELAGSSILSVDLYDVWQQWVFGSASGTVFFDGKVLEYVAVVFARSVDVADVADDWLRIVTVGAENAFVDAFHVVGESPSTLLAGEFVAAVDDGEAFYLLAVPAEYLNDGVCTLLAYCALVCVVAGEVCLGIFHVI